VLDPSWYGLGLPFANIALRWLGDLGFARHTAPTARVTWIR
jgi:hypothetical protein